MAAQVIAKIKLAPLVPFWQDKNSCNTLTQGKVLEVTDDMDLDIIREGISKQILVVIEGEIPEKANGNGSNNIEGTDDIIAMLNNKVDKVLNKGLSTNDYSTEEKNKLSNIEDEANNYVHPATHDADIINQDANHRFVTDEEKDIWNNKAEVDTNAPSLSFNESGELEVKIGNTTKTFISSSSASTEEPEPGTDPNPDTGDTGDDNDNDNNKENTDVFGDYEWKEVYIMTKATNRIDITGSKMIEEFTESGGDDGPFWDDYAAFKYNLYAPRLANKSGVPTTEADDNPNTLIPIYELGQEQGSELASISPSLDGVDWQWLGEGHDYIDLGIIPTTLVVFYLIKSK